MNIKIEVTVRRKSGIHWRYQDPEGKAEASVDYPNGMSLDIAPIVAGLLPMAEDNLVENEDAQEARNG